MGWSFNLRCEQTRAEFVQEMLGKFSLPVYAHHAVGNHLWVVLEQPDGGRFICLVLMKKTADGWGEKAIDEAAHPYYYDCPLALLNCSSPTGGRSGDWRRKVVEYHADKKARPKLAPGLRVLLVGEPYRLLEKRLNHSWTILRERDAQRFKCGSQRLNRAPLAPVESVTT